MNKVNRIFTVRIIIFFLLAIPMLFTITAQANDKVVLQLKWVPQAQFAGYYAALDKSYYEEQGLDVIIKPAGTDISPVQIIAGNMADVIVNWLPDALVAQESGVPLVNIAQIFDKSGLMLLCKRSSGIKTPADLRGKTLGVWFGGNEYPFFNWMSKLGYKQDVDIKILKQSFNVDPLLQNQADCISAMTYNEYLQVLDAGIPASDLISFSYDKERVSTLEDGLYVLKSSLNDPKFVDKMSRFLVATYKGWKYAAAHPKEVAEMIVDADLSGSATVDVQTKQLEQVVKLISNANTPKIGYLEPASYYKTIRMLLNSGSTVISKDPGDSVMDHRIWDKASKLAY